MVFSDNNIKPFVIIRQTAFSTNKNQKENLERLVFPSLLSSLIKSIQVKLMIFVRNSFLILFIKYNSTKNSIEPEQTKINF